MKRLVVGAVVALVVVGGGLFVATRECPMGAELTGLAPPQGTEQWCQIRTADDRFVRHGRYRQWHSNGQLSVEGDYRAGRAEGVFVEYHPNGQRKAEGRYVDGSQHGRWLRWGPDGEKQGEMLFDHGKAPGVAAETAPTAPETTPASAGAGDDPDHDWITDARDNCRQDPNPAQEDLDRDGQGDVCDDDVDGDNFANAHDNCPRVSNAGQNDVDGDRVGDACDDDLDGDGVTNTDDNCRDVVNPDQADSDKDRIGDACEPPNFVPDTDGDGVPDEPNLVEGTPRFCAPGRVTDCFDNCLSIANADQNPAVCQPDADADGDGVRNGEDNCMLVPNPTQARTKGQPPFGFGDACNDDQDGDGVFDTTDNCPFVKNADQRRSRAFGPGDACVIAPTAGVVGAPGSGSP